MTTKQMMLAIRLNRAAAAILIEKLKPHKVALAELKAMHEAFEATYRK